jgi:hypothetical protein
VARIYQRASSLNLGYSTSKIFDPGGSAGLTYCGSVRPPGGRVGSLNPCPDWSAFVTRFPALSVFRGTPSGPREDIAHLKLYLADHLKLQRAPEFYDRLPEAASQLMLQFPLWDPPSWMLSPTPPRFPPFQDFLNAVDSMVPTSSPSFPWLFTKSSKHDFSLDPAPLYGQVGHLWNYLFSDAPDYPADSVSLYESILAGLVLPDNLITKNEIMKDGKKPRVILASHPANEVLERMFYSHPSSAVKKVWGECPSAVGIGHDQQSSDKVVAYWAGEGDVMKNDTPAYDTTVELREDLAFDDVVHFTCSLELPYWLRRGRRRLHRLLQHKFIVTQGGLAFMVFKLKRGTGELITSFFNTGTRVLRSFVVQLILSPSRVPKALAAGDDALERLLHGMMECYARLNIPLREAESCSDTRLDFCSTWWSPGRWPVGQRILKSFTFLLWEEHGLLPHDKLFGFLRLYVGHPLCVELITFALLQRGGSMPIDRAMSDANISNCSPLPLLCDSEPDFCARKKNPPSTAPKSYANPFDDPRVVKAMKRKAKKNQGGTGPFKEVTMKVVNAPVSSGMSTTARTSKSMIVRRRELAFIAYATADGFKVIYQQNVNPGDNSFCAWAAPIAQRHTQYRYRKAFFDFISSNPSTHSGTFAANFDYNASDNAPNGAFQMLASDRAVQWPCYQNSKRMNLDPAELSKKRYVIANGQQIPTGEDPKTYNLGALYVASMGCTAGDSINVWFDYELELFVPVLPNQIEDGSDLSGSIVGSTNCTPSKIFGTSPGFAGILNIDAGLSDGDKVFFRNVGNYIVALNANGAGIANADPTIAVGPSSDASIRPIITGINTVVNAGTQLASIFGVNIQTPDSWISMRPTATTINNATANIGTFYSPFFRDG